MGLDLGLVPTDEVLIQMVKRLAEDYPNRGSVCMFIAKQIKEHDYLGAATTISLSFPQGNDFLDDLPKLLVALSNPPACDYNNLLYILYDILGDISEDGDDFELGQDSYQGFGSYRSVHYFRTFVTLGKGLARRQRNQLRAIQKMVAVPGPTIPRTRYLSRLRRD